MESEWKPIETAPKDGTEILVYDEESGMIDIALWDKESPYGWAFELDENHNWYYYYTVTHWMPLPLPPKD